MAINNPKWATIGPMPAQSTVTLPDVTSGTIGISSAVTAANGAWSSNSGGPAHWVSGPPPTNIITIYDRDEKPCVTLELDGSVTWEDPTKIDEAAEMFSKTLTMSAEIKSGITNGVKTKIRNTIFEEIIQIAQRKGSVTVDDLTYMYESAKIMDKLQGSM